MHTLTLRPLRQPHRQHHKHRSGQTNAETQPSSSEPPREPTAQGSLIADLAQGWDTFRSRTWLWTISIQFALFNLLSWGPLLLLGPVLAKQDLSGARSWGAILAAYALGSVVGGVAVLGRRPPRPLLVATLGTFGYPIPLILFALNASTAEIAAGTLFAGVGSATFNILFSATIQREIPAEMQARVSAFDLVGAYSAAPIAFAAAGPVAALIGAHTVLAFGAAWTLLSSLVVITLPGVRGLRWTANEGEIHRGDGSSAQSSGTPRSG